MKTRNPKILAILILGFIEFGCQNKLNGLYCFDHKEEGSFEYPCYYFNDKMFDYENGTDMGDFYGTGSWEIEKRKLILDFNFMGARHPNYVILYEETEKASDTISIKIENEISKLPSFEFNYRIRGTSKSEIITQGKIHGKGVTEVKVPTTVAPFTIEVDNFTNPEIFKIEKPMNSKIILKFNTKDGRSHELKRRIIYPIKRINKKSFRLKWSYNKYSLFKK